jgi:hypothetical protein
MTQFSIDRYPNYMFITRHDFTPQGTQCRRFLYRAKTVIRKIYVEVRDECFHLGLFIVTDAKIPSVRRIDQGEVFLRICKSDSISDIVN